MVSGVLSIPISGRGLGSRASDGDSYRLALRRFVAGEENQLAAVAIANLLDEKLDYTGPLVFCGATGTGKSHLAIGLAQQFKQHHSSVKVVYTAAVDLARRLDDEPTDEPYRGSYWYTGISLLVVDDVDQLSGSVEVQQQFVRILDAISQSGGRVVVTSQTNPSRQTKIIAPLRSRLCSGLVVPLVKPMIASRRLIVQEVATSRGFLLPPEAIDRLALRLDGTVPELIGAIVQLQVTSQTNHARLVDRQTAADEVEKLLHLYSKKDQVTIHQIAIHSAKTFGVTLAQMRSPTRKKAIVTARGVAIYLARQLTDNSLQQLGDYFGGRDHTTILHSFQKIEQLAKNNRHIAHAIEDVKQRLLKTTIRH